MRRGRHLSIWTACGVFTTTLAVPLVGLAAPSSVAADASAEPDAAATTPPPDVPSKPPNATSSAPKTPPASEVPSGSEAPEGPREEANDAGSPSDLEPQTQTDDEIRPPRVDGAYLGVVLGGGATLVRVNDRDTPGAFLGGGGAVRIGEAVFPWMTIGLRGGGRAGFRGSQRVYQGGVTVELGFLPVPRYPLSLLVGFGVGGGAVHEQDVEGRAGFGGALFNASARYDFFPGVAKRRPNRGGGFSLGPEIGWVGFTPAAKGRPMSNSITLGLWIGYYFGS